jgi:protein-S-isoprenylcysteine O-methyltransferase Ste14
MCPSDVLPRFEIMLAGPRLDHPSFLPRPIQTTSTQGIPKALGSIGTRPFRAFSDAIRMNNRFDKGCSRSKNIIVTLMITDAPFRIILLVLIVFNMGITIYYRRKAARSGDQLSRKEEGYLLAISLRLAGFLLWIATLGYLFFPDFFRWASLPVPDFIRWCGVLLGLLCSSLLAWTLSCLGTNLTDTVVTRTTATLVSHGPYGWVRHPFYVAAAGLMISVTLLTQNGLIGLASLFVLSLLIVRTPKEEARLLERFGKSYQDYIDHTGRFIPRCNGFTAFIKFVRRSR